MIVSGPSDSFGWVDDHLARGLAVEQVLTQAERL